jgi:hypothetical protein
MAKPVGTVRLSYGTLRKECLEAVRHGPVRETVAGIQVLRDNTPAGSRNVMTLSPMAAPHRARRIRSRIPAKLRCQGPGRGCACTFEPEGSAHRSSAIMARSVHRQGTTIRVSSPPRLYSLSGRNPPRSRAPKNGLACPKPELPRCSTTTTRRRRANDAYADRPRTSGRSPVNKLTWAQVGLVTEPRRYMFKFGWLTITADRLRNRRRLTAIFTLSVLMQKGRIVIDAALLI